MTVRNISKVVYKQIEAEGLLSRRRWEVYSALHRHGPCTANELFDGMKNDGLASGRNQQTNLTPRLGELRELGVVFERAQRICKITGRRVIEWEVTNKLPCSGLLARETTKQKIARLEKRIRQLERENDILKAGGKIEAKTMVPFPKFRQLRLF